MATTTSMMMIIVMMFLFIGSVAEGPPYNLYLGLYPCLNCAKWCEDDPQYTCNYTCKWLPLKETFYQINRGLIGVWGSSSSWLYLHHKYPNKWAEPEYPERRKFELETCKNDKDVNCIYRTDVYPLCSHDFKPYDKGMERCCEIFKKCSVTGYYDEIIEDRIQV
uniref:Uncharacterized protein n=1 Tax=Meloidogyne enterolobii TaxID=390850 RepID=A0A6V7VHV9_MELEN|nr:unnamed protein product [Meloidogyne enterolobii]